MEIDTIVRPIKELYIPLINFIDSKDETNDNFNSLTDLIETLKISHNRERILTLLHIISAISNNHHRTPDFLNKIEQILSYVIKNKQVTISNDEILDIFKSNKRILLLILEKQMIVLEDIDINFLINLKDPNNMEYSLYLYPSINKFLDKSSKEKIEAKILNFFNDLQTFEENCHKGENNSYVCQLIRDDNIEEFIQYVNKTNLPLTGTIAPSLFETNPLLLDHEKVTLIEYAAFFGSIQIFQYLHLNKVPLESSLWIYAIHSNDPELIQFLEDNHISPKMSVAL